MNSDAEQKETVPGPKTAGAPKAGEKPHVVKGARHVTSSKPKPGKKATPAKKAPRAAQAEPKNGPRVGSKTETILELLKRSGGATAKEMMKATGWQPHSLRGFLSGTVRKKMGLTVVSTKNKDGDRTYTVNS